GIGAQGRQQDRRLQDCRGSEGQQPIPRLNRIYGAECASVTQASTQSRPPVGRAIPANFQDEPLKGLQYFSPSL
ncbi:MAG TPA: hypothetical protein VII48_12075, partial [Rhizomicrobium sp.]